MEKRFKATTVLSGIITGASTIAMIICNKPFTYVTGIIAILSFIGLFIKDFKGI